MNPALLQAGNESAESFSRIRGEPGSRARAAPGGGGPRGPMPTTAQVGLGSWNRRQFGYIIIFQGGKAPSFRP